MLSVAVPNTTLKSGGGTEPKPEYKWKHIFPVLSVVKLEAKVLRSSVATERSNAVFIFPDVEIVSVFADAVAYPPKLPELTTLALASLSLHFKCILVIGGAMSAEGALKTLKNFLVIAFLS